MSDRETSNAKNAESAVTALRQLAREEISRGGVADRVLVEAVAGNAIKVRALGSAVPGAQLIPIIGFVPAVGSEVLLVRTFGGQLVAIPLTSMALGTGAGQVPTSDQVQQPLSTYVNGTFDKLNPTDIDIRAGTGIAVTKGSGGGGTQMILSQSEIEAPFVGNGGLWLSTHNTFPTRNATPTTVALNANTAYGTPVRVRRKGKVTAIGFAVTTAGASMRVGVFKVDALGAGMFLHAQSGIVSVSTVGWKQVSISGATSMAAGIYMVVLLASAAVTCQGMAATGVAESPWGSGGYTPVSSYQGGAAIPTTYAFFGGYAYAALPSSFALSMANLNDNAMPVGWMNWLPD